MRAGLLAGLSTLIVLCTTAGAGAAPTAAPAAAPAAPAAAEAGSAAAAPVCVGRFENDARLGPAVLPAPGERPVGPLLEDWRRTGLLSSEEFLRKYWRGSPESGGWRYPPNDGFAEINGHVDKYPMRLERGSVIDRFGSERGRFLAPAGTLFKERSLPPQSLNTRDPEVPCDYRQYEVLRPFTVWAGTTAAWFEQPGGGQQFMLDARFMSEDFERIDVAWLIAAGYLKRVLSPSDLPVPAAAAAR
ncbi:TNT domain-containing protein [Streptomyces sp. YIM 98790]|uniref:TNT domain-containing protein n=1 Tax=Streptomyces sp. YIM 98790 TaxID=2689077 RepID=UPI0028BEA307|nr:TNT domain-containing protein [Streptomyces sp. YIM 98790]